jgi:hypothetical protein
MRIVLALHHAYGHVDTLTARASPQHRKQDGLLFLHVALDLGREPREHVAETGRDRGVLRVDSFDAACGLDERRQVTAQGRVIVPLDVVGGFGLRADLPARVRVSAFGFGRDPLKTAVASMPAFVQASASVRLPPQKSRRCHLNTRVALGLMCEVAGSW